MKLFIDTNVLIDFVCQREGFSKEASILFDLFHKGKIELAISALSIINAYYVGTKYRIPYEKLQDSLKSISSMVEVVSLDQSILKDAFGLSVKDFEDASQYYSARRCNADYIVTRNKADFPFSQITVLSPLEILSQLL